MHWRANASCYEDHDNSDQILATNQSLKSIEQIQYFIKKKL